MAWIVDSVALIGSSTNSESTVARVVASHTGNYVAGGTELAMPDKVVPMRVRKILGITVEDGRGFTLRPIDGGKFKQKVADILVERYDYPGVAAGVSTEVPAGALTIANAVFHVTFQP